MSTPPLFINRPAEAASPVSQPLPKQSLSSRIGEKVTQIAQKALVILYEAYLYLAYGVWGYDLRNRDFDDFASLGKILRSCDRITARDREKANRLVLRSLNDHRFGKRLSNSRGVPRISHLDENQQSAFNYLAALSYRSHLLFHKGGLEQIGTAMETAHRKIQAGGDLTFSSDEKVTKKQLFLAAQAKEFSRLLDVAEQHTLTGSSRCSDYVERNRAAMEASAGVVDAIWADFNPLAQAVCFQMDRDIFESKGQSEGVIGTVRRWWSGKHTHTSYVYQPFDKEQPWQAHINPSSYSFGHLKFIELITSEFLEVDGGALLTREGEEHLAAHWNSHPLGVRARLYAEYRAEMRSLLAENSLWKGVPNAGPVGLAKAAFLPHTQRGEISREAEAMNRGSGEICSGFSAKLLVKAYRRLEARLREESGAGDLKLLKSPVGEGVHLNRVSPSSLNHFMRAQGAKTVRPSALLDKLLVAPAA